MPDSIKYRELMSKDNVQVIDSFSASDDRHFFLVELPSGKFKIKELSNPKNKIIVCTTFNNETDSKDFFRKMKVMGYVEKIDISKIN